MKEFFIRAACALCLAWVTTGCAGEKKPPEQATPEGTLHKMTAAMLACDRDRFQECLTGSKTEVAAGRAFIEYAAALGKFRDAVVRTYGDEARRVFEREGGSDLRLDLKAFADRLLSMKCRLSGDSAVCTVEGEPEAAISLTRKKNLWYVQAGDVFTGDREQLAYGWYRMAEVLNRMRDSIGKSGVTPEGLDRQIAQEKDAIWRFYERPPHEMRDPGPPAER